MRRILLGIILAALIGGLGAGWVAAKHHPAQEKVTIVGSTALQPLAEAVAARYRQGQPVELTPKEFQLLSYLINHHNQVLSREQLVSGVWGYDLLASSRIVDIHISHLRDKLEDDPHKPAHLLTVRGFGYKFV